MTLFRSHDRAGHFGPAAAGLDYNLCMPARTNERREFQRLHLENSLPARYGGQDVEVVDIGVTGARIVHGKPFRRGASRRLIRLFAELSVSEAIGVPPRG